MCESQANPEDPLAVVVGELILGVPKVIGKHLWKQPYPPAMEASDSTPGGVNVEGEPFSGTVSNTDNSIICVPPANCVARYIMLMRSGRAEFRLTPEQLGLAPQ